MSDRVEGSSSPYVPNLEGAPGSEAPVKTHPAVRRADTASSVESWQGAGDVPQAAQSASGLAPAALKKLDARVATEEVNRLMSRTALDWSISEDDCRAAVGVLTSLAPSEYAKAIAALSRSGALQVLCEKAPADVRTQLVESAVQGGLTSQTRERLAPGLRKPQPPPQPALIANLQSLPPELRGLIHAENASRGAAYREAFARYTDAWCQRVGQCRTPAELRALGPLSTPPRLLEPGISPEDFKAKRFTGDLAPTNMGLERAARAVSQRIDAFREGLGAGQAGLTAEAKGQLKGEGPLRGQTVVGTGLGVETKGTIASDGRVVESKVDPQATLEIGYHEVAKAELKFNDEHLEKIAVEVLGSGVELSRSGEVTLKGGVGGGVAVEVEVNPREATMGAALVGEEEADAPIGSASVEGKIGFVYRGVPREYYPDIGGTQEGFFGPMPELDAKVAWRSLPEDRRAWYARQGFNEGNWPH